MRRQKLTGKIPTDKPPDPENGQRHGYSDLGDHVVAFPSRPAATPILGVAMYTSNLLVSARNVASVPMATFAVSKASGRCASTVDADGGPITPYQAGFQTSLRCQRPCNITGHPSAFGHSAKR
jgi:hypothetical protein